MCNNTLNTHILHLYNCLRAVSLFRAEWQLIGIQSNMTSYDFMAVSLDYLRLFVQPVCRCMQVLVCMFTHRIYEHVHRVSGVNDYVKLSSV